MDQYKCSLKKARKTLPSPGLVKFPGSLDLEHKVATIHILHNEEQTILSLKQKYQATDLAS
jgi:hypothetical protein